MKPLILISNDDGYSAKGIKVLADMMRSKGDVIVVAPDGGRSGAALSITSKVPVMIELKHDEPGYKVYSCNGTPCDCIKMACDQLLPRRPDLILAGINHGDNASVNVHYSGTMGIAIEGCMKGIPSIGFSSCKTDSDANFEPMKPYIYKVIDLVLGEGLPFGVCLNVNAPVDDDIKGIRLCRMGNGEWTNEWEERKSPRGCTYYWLTGSFIASDEDDESTDRWALSHGYVSVTPIQLDMTAYEWMKDRIIN